jgi:hypothetical protein
VLIFTYLFSARLPSTSSLTCPCPSSHYSVRCIPALHVVFLPCYSHGIRLRHSYCFVLDHLFINQILYFLLSTALMCLAITPVAVLSINRASLSQAALTITFPSIQSLASTLLADTTLDFSSRALFPVSTSSETTGFLLDS